jgi:4-diphosphocytidyl-2-C-methyl-D-erythritol kinase
MLSERFADGVTVWAPAKVNLFLEVLGKRPDGYHEIASLMVAVNLFDTLEFKEEFPERVLLSCDHPVLPTGPTNLICRAAELLRQRHAPNRGASITLRKRIPMAAGLAGGSSDAAATLFGLDRLWGLNLGAARLAELGAEIGSDVAFFFSAPAAFCTGRGEKVEPVHPKKGLDLVLACPRQGLSTAAVYGNVTVPTSPVAGDVLRAAFEAGDAEAVGRLLHNRLQEPAGRLCAEVNDLRGRLAALKPAGQLMSGSGTCVFAVCRDSGEALRVARGLSESLAGTAEPHDVVPARIFLVRSCF